VGAHGAAEVGVGPQEQAKLYFEGSEPQADVKRGLNPVVAVTTACVYVWQKDCAEAWRVGSADGNMAR